MSVIYEPKGRAKEYCDLAVNLFTGCTNNCRYCYVPDVLHKDTKEFHATCNPRFNILKSLEKEAPGFRGKEVMLCFTCDPFPNDDKLVDNITIPALEILGDNGIIANILTKNPSRAATHSDLFVKYGFKLGTTLLFTANDLYKEWEDGADSPLKRMMIMEYMHNDKGIYTWVSIEPVIDTSQALSVIRQMHNYIDFWKVGKINGRDEKTKEIEKSIDWKKFYYDVKASLDLYKAKYYIKKDLKAFA